MGLWDLIKTSGTYGYIKIIEGSHVQELIWNTRLRKLWNFPIWTPFSDRQLLWWGVCVKLHTSLCLMSLFFPSGIKNDSTVPGTLSQLGPQSTHLSVPHACPPACYQNINQTSHFLLQTTVPFHLTAEFWSFLFSSTFSFLLALVGFTVILTQVF